MDFVPNKQQRKVMDAIISGDLKEVNMTGVYRRTRSHYMTTLQLATFNRICAEGKKRIQWHSPSWVAMDRKSFEKLQAAASKSKIEVRHG